MYTLITDTDVNALAIADLISIFSNLFQRPAFELAGLQRTCLYLQGSAWITGASAWDHSWIWRFVLFIPTFSPLRPFVARRF